MHCPGNVNGEWFYWKEVAIAHFSEQKWFVEQREFKEKKYSQLNLWSWLMVQRQEVHVKLHFWISKILGSCQMAGITCTCVRVCVCMYSVHVCLWLLRPAESTPVHPEGWQGTDGREGQEWKLPSSISHTHYSQTPCWHTTSDCAPDVYIAGNSH